MLITRCVFFLPNTQETYACLDPNNIQTEVLTGGLNFSQDFKNLAMVWMLIAAKIST